MFSLFHIHQFGTALCHTSGGIYINFDEAAGINPSICCEDCRRRYKNITGIDLKKQTIDKVLLRSKMKYFNH